MKPYWFIAHSKAIRERSGCEDFLASCNKHLGLHFKLTTASHERPDCLAVDENKDQKLAIEMTMLFDDNNVVRRNLKQPDPDKWVRTALTKEDIYKIIQRKDAKSFEQLPHGWHKAKKVLVIDIDKAYDPDGLLAAIDAGEIKSLKCANIEAVYLFYYHAGSPGSWEYEEYLTN